MCVELLGGCRGNQARSRNAEIDALGEVRMYWQHLYRTGRRNWNPVDLFVGWLFCFVKGVRYE